MSRTKLFMGCRGRIKTVMATGDHPLTAMSVALSCGMLSPDTKRLLIELPHNRPQGVYKDGDSCTLPAAFRASALPINPAQAAKLKLPPLAQRPPTPLKGSDSFVDSRISLGSLPASKPLLGSPKQSAAAVSSADHSNNLLVAASHTPAASVQEQSALAAGAQVPRLQASPSGLAALHSGLQSQGLVQAWGDSGSVPRVPANPQYEQLKGRLLSSSEDTMQAVPKPGNQQSSGSPPKAKSLLTRAWSWRPHRIAHSADEVPHQTTTHISSRIGHAQSTPPGFKQALAAQHGSGEYEVASVELVHAHSAQPDFNQSKFQQLPPCVNFTPALADLKCTLAEDKMLHPVKVGEAMTKIAEGAECVITGPVFEHLLQHAAPAELELVLRSTAVCARMRARQKAQLVQLLGKAGLSISANRQFQVS